MIESAARAGAAGPRSSVSSFYTWDVPKKAFSIQVSASLIARLDREVIESFRSVTARGSEVGGLLLGTVVAGARPVVVVEDCELIPCDYSRGPLYRLSDQDKERLDQAIRLRATTRDQRLSPVGFFRSNTRKGLSLDADDVALFTQRFNHPHNVFLLVRPFATRRSVAGFFIWENGAIQAEQSALEFPFAMPETPQREPVRPAAPEDAPAEKNAPAPEPPAPKPVVRAQVVPIAPRHEPLPAMPAEPPVAPEAPPDSEPAQEAAPAAAAIETPEEVKPESSPGRSRWIWIGAGAAVLLLAITGVLVYPGFRRPAAPQPVLTNVDTANLALRVERTAGQLVLTWNREAESVKTATRAVLSISDGNRQEDVQLDLPQLRNGSVVYSPLTADVNFRLAVTSSNPAKSQSEYMRVLGRPSAMPATALPAPPNAAGPNAAAAPPDANAAALPAAGASPSTTGPARWRAPDSLAERLRPVRVSELPEPPSLEVPAGQPGSALPTGLSSAPGVPVPPPPAPATQASTPARPAAAVGQAQPKVGGNVQEARVISRTSPAYPLVARQARIQGVVQLEATVSRDGTVKEVRVISGHPLLRQAAVDAVKLWKYSPTTLNGQPVEATTQVSIAFGGPGN